MNTIIESLRGKTFYLAPCNIASLFTFSALRRLGINAALFCDNDPLKQGIVYKGAEITGFENAVKKNPNAPVILCSWISKQFLSRQLKENGFKNIIDYNELWDELGSYDALCDLDEDFIKQKLPQTTETLHLKHLEIKKMHIPISARGTNSLALQLVSVGITNHCTLKCKHCNSLMQYYTKPRHYEAKKITDGLSHFMSCVDFVGTLDICGAEPTLHPHLAQIVRFAGGIKNKGLCSIITNGTVIPKQDVFDALRESNVTVKISHYGIYSTKIEPLKELLTKNNVLYQVQEFRMGWQARFGLVDGRERTQEEVESIYNDCVDQDINIIENKIMRCNFITYAHDLSAIPFNKEDYVDVNEPNLKENLKAYIARKNAYPGCRNCGGGKALHAKPLPVAEQADAPLSYHKY